MGVVVDTNANEDAFAEELRGLGVEVARERLDVGDLQITVGDEIVVFERKTLADLSASILDGRWQDQKLRMLDSEREEKVTYCYVVEGGLRSWNETIPYGLAMKNIQCALVKAQLRDGMRVFHTTDTFDTANLAAYVLKQQASGGFIVDTQRSSRMCALKRKRDNLDDPVQVLIAMLCVIPGMSVHKACAITSQWRSVADLSRASAHEIASLKAGDRKIGPKLASRICAVFSAE